MKKMNITYVSFLLILGACSFLFAGLEHDILVTASLNSESDINPDMNFPEFSTDESDARFTLDAEYTFTTRTSDQDSMGFIGGLQLNMYMEEDQYNNDAIDIAGFYQREDMGPFTFYATFRYTHYSVDGDAYVYMSTLTPALYWEQNEKFMGVFSFRMHTLGYYNYDALDGVDFGFEYKQIWFIDEKSELAASLFINDVSLDADEMSYFGIRAGVEYTMLIQRNWEVNAVLYFGNKSFAEDFPGEGEPRSENYINVAAVTNYDFGKIGKVFGGLTYFNNMSNVDIFDVDRVVITAGYMYKFEF